jgi:hypothetical protein
MHRTPNPQNVGNPNDGFCEMETQEPVSNDDQFIASATPSKEHRVCGAKLRGREGRFCKRLPVPGRTRCLYHGGRTPRGADSPHFKHGHYSKVLPKNLRGSFEKLMSDPTLLECRAEVALLQIRLCQLVSRVGTNESGAAWRELDRLFDEFTATNDEEDEAKGKATLKRMRELIKGRVEDTEAWADLQAAIESATRVSAREWKRIIGTQHVATAEEVRAIVASIANAVLQNVPDKAARANIAAAVNSLRVIEPITAEE